MIQLFHPLLTLVATASDSLLARYVLYMKKENRILRDRLPGEIHTKPHERAQLLKYGKPLGTAINELITIVTPGTISSLSAKCISIIMFRNLLIITTNINRTAHGNICFPAQQTGSYLPTPCQNISGVSVTSQERLRVKLTSDPQAPLCCLLLMSWQAGNRGVQRRCTG